MRNNSICHAVCVFVVSIGVILAIDMQATVKENAVPDEDVGATLCEKTFLRRLCEPIGQEMGTSVAYMLNLMSQSENGFAKHPFSKSEVLRISKLMNIDKKRLLLIKRLKPKFNPTGWRKKRSINEHHRWDVNVNDLKTLLFKKRILNTDDTRRRQESLCLPKRTVFNGRRNYRYTGNAFKLKRKPLKFNPTGW